MTRRNTRSTVETSTESPGRPADHPESAPSNKTLNGVLLYTKDGRPRRRFSYDEYCRMAGLSDDDLGYLVNFFIPRRDMVATQSRALREGPKDRRWYSRNRPYSFLRLKALLVRHLLGDLVPGVQPFWVASRARDWTKVPGKNKLVNFGFTAVLTLL